MPDLAVDPEGAAVFVLAGEIARRRARLVKIAPIDDRFGRSRLTRATLKFVLATMSILVVGGLHVQQADVELPGLARHAAAADESESPAPRRRCRCGG